MSELSWKDFRKQVFSEMMEIVEFSNCARFKILGYKYLDIRLILYFDDCNQVFDFSKNGEECGYTVTKFFTKDKSHEEHMEDLGRWKEDTERDIKE